MKPAKLQGLKFLQNLRYFFFKHLDKNRKEQGNNFP